MIRANPIVTKILGFNKNSHMIGNICKILDVPYQIERRGKKAYILIDEFDTVLLADFLLLSKNQRCEYTCLKKYGVSNVSKLQAIKDKKEKTTAEHYGVKNPFQSPEVKEKIKETNLQNLGVEYPMQSPEVRRKSVEFYMKKYGVANSSCLPEQRELRRRKMIELNTAGVTLPKRCLFGGMHFDSTWEVIYYYYQKYFLGNDIQRGRVFHYFKDGEEHSYRCDFLVNGENVEAKGDQFIRDGFLYNPYSGENLEEKTRCMKENRVKVITGKDIDGILTVLKKSGKIPEGAENGYKSRS